MKTILGPIDLIDLSTMISRSTIEHQVWILRPSKVVVKRLSTNEKSG